MNAPSRLQSRPIPRSDPVLTESLSGTVDRLHFSDPKTGFTVASLKPSNSGPSVPIKGFLHLVVGQTVKLCGAWEDHASYGRQFRVSSYQTVPPTHKEGMVRYLGSGLIKAIGPVRAKAIVNQFGEDTLTIIDREPDRLLEVPGIGTKRLALIRQAWVEQASSREAMLFLHRYGITGSIARRIFKEYGHKTLAVVQSDPYQLARNVAGIGFLTADRIATDIGIASTSSRRLRAGVIHVLQEASKNGHLFLPEKQLIRQVNSALRTSHSSGIADAIEAEIQVGTLARCPARPNCESRGAPASAEDSIYLAYLQRAELDVATGMLSLLTRPSSGPGPSHTYSWLKSYCLKHDLVLTQEQALAVELAASSQVLVLTGGPGTGKTTTLKAIVAYLKHLGNSVLLAAPTGRAAQRMAEVIGLAASTVHRMLLFDPKTGKFSRNEKHPLEANVVIIDETSMLDVTMAAHLMSAISRTTRLILVGDVDQLPSVGPGDVLRDLIASARLPLVQLTQVFRQAEQSLIIRNAHQINRGAMPQLVRPGEENADCLFVERESPEDVARTIVALASTVLPRKMNMDPTSDVLVLAPMNRGACGVIALNQALQVAINPADPHKLEFNRDRLFRTGDRVLATRNDYAREIFNGDLGVIERIDMGNERFIVRFPSKAVRYGFEQIAHLTHGYALSIHKSQGSEFPCVIIAIHNSHYVMLSRQILYTALTRAKRFCVFVGTRKAIAIATREAAASKRFTRLSSLLTTSSPSDTGRRAEVQLFDTLPV